MGKSINQIKEAIAERQSLSEVLGKTKLSEEQVTEGIVKFNTSFDASKQTVAEFCKQEGAANSSLEKYLTGIQQCKDAGVQAKASQDGYNASLSTTTIKARAASLGMTALRAALNFAVIFIATEALEKFIEWIDKTAHATENAQKAWDDLSKSYASNSKTITDNISSLKSMQTEFSGLAKGVDDNGKNVSLSTDEYAKYKEEISKIADMCPTLVQGYNDEGTALVNKNTVIQDAINLEKQLYEQKKQEYLQKSASDIDTASKGTNDSTAFDIGTADKLIKNILNTTATNTISQASSMLQKITDDMNQFGVDYEALQKGDVEASENLVQARAQITAALQTDLGLSDEQLSKLNAQIDAVSTQVDKRKTLQQQEVDDLKVATQGTDYYNKISNAGDLQAFYKTLEKLVKNNPSDNIESLRTKAENLGNTLAKVVDKIPLDRIQDFQKQLSSGKIDKDTYLDKIKGYTDSLDQIKESCPECADAIGLIEAAWKDAANSSSEAAAKGSDALSDYKTDLTKAESEISSLSDLVTKYQKSGSLSSSDVQSALSSHPEFYKYLVKEGNQYKINERALADLKDTQGAYDEGVSEYIEKEKGSTEGTKDFAKSCNDMINAIDKAYGASSKNPMSEQLQNMLGNLKTVNKQFQDGTVSATDYFDTIQKSIDKVDWSNLKGDESLQAGISNLAESAAGGLQYLTKQFQSGKIGVSDYSRGLESASRSEEELIAKTNDLTQVNGKWEYTAKDVDDATRQAGESAANQANDLQEAETEMESYNSIISAVQGNIGYLSQNLDSAGMAAFDSADLASTSYQSLASTVASAVGNMETVNATGYNDIMSYVQNATGFTSESINATYGSLENGMMQNAEIGNAVINGSVQASGNALQNLAHAGGSVLTALGNAIKSFNYKITFRPNVVGYTKSDLGLGWLANLSGIKAINIPNIDFNISGSGSGAVADLGSAISKLGSSLSAIEIPVTIKSFVPSGTIPALNNVAPALNNVGTAGKNAGNGANDAANGLKNAKQAAEDATKALEAQKQALQDRVTELKNNQSAIQSLLDLEEKMLKQKYDDEKSRIQDLEDEDEKRHKNQTEALDDEIDKIKKKYDKEKDLADKQLDADTKRLSLEEQLLEDKKDEDSYQKDLTSKNDELNKLQEQYNSLQNDDSAEAMAKRLDLQDQIAKKKTEIDDYQHDHSLDLQKDQIDKEKDRHQDLHDKKAQELEDEYNKQESLHDAKVKELDDEYNKQKEIYDKQIKDIENYTSKEINIRTEAMNLINAKSQDTYNLLILYNKVYGDGIDANVDKIWNEGYAALEKYCSGNIDILHVMNYIVNQTVDLNNQIKALEPEIAAAKEASDALSGSLGSAGNAASGLASDMGDVADSAYNAADAISSAASAVDKYNAAINKRITTVDQFLKDKAALENVNQNPFSRKAKQDLDYAVSKDTPGFTFDSTLSQYYHTGTPSVDKKYGNQSFEELYTKIKNGDELQPNEVPSVLLRGESVISNEDKPKWVNAFNDLINDVSDGIPTQQLASLKDSISVPNNVSLSNINQSIKIEQGDIIIQGNTDKDTIKQIDSVVSKHNDDLINSIAHRLKMQGGFNASKR